MAQKQGKKIYIQVSDNIDDEKMLSRETTPLLQIKYAYPKILFVRTKHDSYQYKWIEVVDISKMISIIERKIFAEYEN